MHSNLAPPVIGLQSSALPSPADWLQFGALGLLAFVLVGAFVLARLHLEGIRRIDERLDKLVEVLLATATDEERRRYLENVSRRPAAGDDAIVGRLADLLRANQPAFGITQAPGTSPASSNPPSTGP